MGGLTILHNGAPITDVTPGGVPVYVPGFEMAPAERQNAVQGLPGRMLQIRADGVDIGNARPAVIDIVAEPGRMLVTRGVGENAHVVTVTGDLPGPCQTNVILQTSFPGGDSTDISPQALGAGVLSGATLHDGYLRLIGNAGDGAGNTTQSLYWQDPILIRAAGEPKTFEFFMNAVELVSNPPEAIMFMRYIQIDDVTELRMWIEGAIGGINRLNFQQMSGGFGIGSWTDSIDCYTAGQRHIAVSIYDDPMAVANTMDLYVEGVLVHTATDLELTATSARVQFQGGTQVFPNRMQIDISGVRVTNERIYSGASFTPPTEFLPPCPP